MQKFGIKLEEAQLIVEAATVAAKAPVAVAVVGLDGNLIAFVAMDGVMSASKKLAADKAYTAIMTDRDTMAWETREKPIDVSNFNDSRLTFIGGGVLIKRGDYLIGGLGISGERGGSSKDHDLAMEVLRGFS